MQADEEEKRRKVYVVRRHNRSLCVKRQPRIMQADALLPTVRDAASHYAVVGQTLKHLDWIGKENAMLSVQVSTTATPSRQSLNAHIQ